MKVKKILSIVLLLGLGFWYYLSLERHPQTQLQSLRGAPQGGDFSLQGEQGVFKLSQLKGKVVLIYFGFTNCPDFCPTMFADVVSMLKTMSPRQQEQIRILFISIDPERDSLPNLVKYAAHFHPNIIPLTGQPEQLRWIAQQYGAFFNKMPIDSAMGYTMDHSTQLFVVDQEGRFKGQISHGLGIEETKSKLLQMIGNF